MKVLIAEDEPDILMQYCNALESAGHDIVASNNGDECLAEYHKALNEKAQVMIHSMTGKHTSGETAGGQLSWNNSPFDAVVLDYRMPKKDGMQVAKEILKINPRQRIIFASAHVKSTLEESIKQLNQIVELIQKPFDLDVLVDVIEDKEIYAALQKLNVNIQLLKGMDPSHDQLRDLLKGLKNAMKSGSFQD